MKQNYDKHIERMENWKDIATEEDWACKTRLVPLCLMGWEAPMPNVMLEFLTHFLSKGHISTLGIKTGVCNQQTIDCRCFWSV